MKRNESSTAVKTVLDAKLIAKQRVVVGSQINLKEVSLVAGCEPSDVSDSVFAFKTHMEVRLSPRN